MNKRNVSIGTLLCLIASMSWGAMFPVAHSALQYIDPLYFSFFRYVFVSVLLVILLYFKEGTSAFRLEGRGLQLAFFGVMGFTVYNFMIFSGQDLLGASGTIIASIMEALMPMITVVILWYRTKIKPASLFNVLPVPDSGTLLSIKLQMSFMVIFPGLIALLSWNVGVKLLSPINGILFMSLVPVTTFILISLQGYAVSMSEFFGTLLVIWALVYNNFYQRKALKMHQAAIEH